jgi:hypothetical protein
MSNPIDDETYLPHRDLTKDEIRQGNPGRPQSEYEDPPAGPSDEPPEGADRKEIGAQ